jgi:hypothetical protein
MIKSLTMLVVFLLVSAPFDATGDSQQLQLELGLSKKTFLLNEPIWLDVTLTNVSTDTVRILGLCLPCRDGSFDIELEDDHGNVVPYTGRVNIMASRNGWAIHSQEEHYECFDLLEFFRSGQVKGLVNRLFLRFLDPGKYEVRAQYRGGIYSNKIVFEVVEPTGDEKEAYQLLNKAFSFLSDNPDLHRQKLQELIDQFPNSMYVEKVYRELFQPGELLQKFPNSGYCEFSLRNLSGDLDPTEKREFLENVIQDHPETRSAKYAQQMLKWLEE